jgi:transposase InsO family protein
VRTKDLCWYVGTIYDPRELPGVSTVGPGIGRGVTFTKWIEAKPIAKLKSLEVVTFFCDTIYQFREPNSIIIDNGTKFMGEPFLQSCYDFNIRVEWCTVAHPRTNGQVERANGLILQGLCNTPGVYRLLDYERGR